MCVCFKGSDLITGLCCPIEQCLQVVHHPLRVSASCGALQDGWEKAWCLQALRKAAAVQQAGSTRAETPLPLARLAPLPPHIPGLGKSQAGRARGKARWFPKASQPSGTARAVPGPCRGLPCSC